jgi:hypothetical protein
MLSRWRRRLRSWRAADAPEASTLTWHVAD